MAKSISSVLTDEQWAMLQRVYGRAAKAEQDRMVAEALFGSTKETEEVAKQGWVDLINLLNLQNKNLNFETKVVSDAVQ